MKEWGQTIAVICAVAAAFAALAGLMQFEHASIRSELVSVREQLNSVDRRTARIEGHLFGLELPPEQADGE